MDEIRLLSQGQGSGLSFPDHVHGLDSGDRPARGWIALESQQRLADPFDEPMILLDDIIEVLPGFIGAIPEKLAYIEKTIVPDLLRACGKSSPDFTPEEMVMTIIDGIVISIEFR